VPDLICIVCSASWQASEAPLCPACLAASWDATPDLVREKHDPAVVASHDSYRSVVSSAFLRRRREILDYASIHGRWYFDAHYGCYVHYTPTPLGVAPGVGIPAGKSAPDHALDSLMIAEAESAPHVFAVDRVRMEAQIRAGEFHPLEACEAASCANLRVPFSERCAAHVAPPRARSKAST